MMHFLENAQNEYIHFTERHASKFFQFETCLAIISVAADGETPSPIPTYIHGKHKLVMSI